MYSNDAKWIDDRESLRTFQVAFMPHTATGLTPDALSSVNELKQNAFESVESIFSGLMSPTQPFVMTTKISKRRWIVSI